MWQWRKTIDEGRILVLGRVCPGQILVFSVICRNMWLLRSPWSFEKLHLTPFFFKLILTWTRVVRNNDASESSNLIHDGNYSGEGCSTWERLSQVYTRRATLFNTSPSPSLADIHGAASVREKNLFSSNRTHTLMALHYSIIRCVNS